MNLIKSFVFWLVVICVLVGGLLAGRYYFPNTPPVPPSDKLYSQKEYDTAIENTKKNAVDDYITKTAEENLKLKTEQEEKEKKEGVIRVDQKNHIIPQGLYELNGWLFTPAGHHIAHGSPVYIQFNFHNLGYESLLWWQNSPIGAVSSGFVIVIHHPLKPKSPSTNSNPNPDTNPDSTLNPNLLLPHSPSLIHTYTDPKATTDPTPNPAVNPLI